MTLERMKRDQPTMAGPLAIGGIGGSGTRLVAAIALRLGIYMGGDLNRGYHDNLWFTLLFKRPRTTFRWASLEDMPDMELPTRVFTGAMNGRRPWGPRELACIGRATTEIGLFGHNHDGHGRGRWALERARSLLRAPPPDPDALGWGWKEPNTHLFLDQLASAIPGLRYVHVIRNGLDMAFSRNQQQLHNWGRLFGIRVPRSTAELPLASLEYWLRANRRAIALGRQLLDERFLLFNFDEFCADRPGGVRRIASFAGAEPQVGEIDRLASLVKPPPGLRRHEAQDMSVFPMELTDAVREMGFDVRLRREAALG
jgi:hypothetical protein